MAKILSMPSRGAKIAPKVVKLGKSLSALRIKVMPKGKRVWSEEVSIYEFFRRKYLSCTVQRDTQLRLKKAIDANYGHLTALLPVHCVVFVTTVNGRDFQIDAHTRALGWITGQIEAPSHVTLIHVPCESIPEMEKAYYCFDSKAAVEKPRDLVFGAFRANTLDAADFSSPLLIQRAIATALSELANRDSTKSQGERFTQVVKKYRKPLLQLDACGFDTNISAGTVAAALILFKYEPVSKAGEIAIFLTDLKRAQSLATVGVTGNFLLYRNYIEDVKANGTIGGGKMVTVLQNLALYLWVQRKRNLTKLVANDMLKKYAERFVGK